MLRHRLSTRLWHWTNAVAMIVLLMSGLMIFNAHPRLYWGHYGANADPAWLEIRSTATTGYLRIGTLRIETTGVLGRWTDHRGQVQTRAFPGWATIPADYSLSAARRWHIAFAWIFGPGIVLYLLWSLANRHLFRDILPSRAELRAGHLWQDIKNHARLRFPRGEATLRYNSLQKLSYFAVIVLLLPLMLLTGLAMSPAMDAAWPWLIDLFGGRQSARSLHFIAAAALALFVLAHLLMVLLSGPCSGVRAMITGGQRP